MKNIIVFLIFLFTINLVYSQKKIPILQHNKDIEIKEISQLNTKYRETNLSISPDGKYLYFMSDRGGQSWSSYPSTFNGKPSYDGDIWYSEKIGKKWISPKCLSKKINTYSGEDEPNVSPDGQRVVYQSWKGDWQSTGGPYYISEMNGSKWGKPKGLGGGITSFFKAEYNKRYSYATDGMSISPDGKTFIVACGSEYEGNMDLYISQKQNNQWQFPKKLNVSTKGDEQTVFIAGDGHTIFFASSGHGGFGGLDIFKADLDNNGRCTNIQNIGAPFNTKKDDYGFIVTASGTEAYFVREGDIYFAKLPPNNTLSPQPTVIVSGILTDCSNMPLETYISLKDDNGIEISNSKTSVQGEYIFSFPEKAGRYSIYDSENNLLRTFIVKNLNKYQELKFDLKNCNRIKGKTKGAMKEN